VAISEAELNHLISLEATFAQKKSGINVTKPLILDPPDYSACIADLQSVTQSQTTAKHAVKANTLDTSALKSECQTNYEQLERGKLEYLIFTDWVLGEANRLGLKASSAEVERQMEATKQGFEKHPDGYQKFLQESGMTNADLLRQITFSQLESELSRKISSEETAKKTPAPPVPHAQIASYYKRNISKYEHPEGRVVQLLVTETRSAAQKAKSEIQSGKSFASVDKRVSMDPDPYTKEHGGEFGELEQGELEAEKVTMPGVFSSSDAKTLAKAIFSAREGALEGPVNTHDASYVLEVKHITGRKPTETLTQVEGEIRLRLAENQPQTQPSFGQLLEKHWRAQTNCAKSLVVSYCEQYKALKQETPAEALKV
jgi:parvulin-like peptidyl-prolyl isomerase